MQQLIGETLHNRYSIQTLLSKKTGRRTFLAQDLKTQKLVIIKLILFGPDFSWDDFKLFEREVKTLQSIDHPAVPKYLDYFELETELGNGFALAQTYINAKTLQEWSEAGRIFSEADIKAIAEQLLEIMNYLHSLHPPVIHRDIKPSNILLGDRSGNSPGKVYLVDFGSVQTVTQSGTITIVGTYGYMPPEQFAGQTTPASDLYSLGATLVYLLTKTHPANLPSRRGRIQFESQYLSNQFMTWLKCLIEPEVSQRFKSAELTLKALQNNAFFPISNNLELQPKDSRLILIKNENYFKIKIPSLQVYGRIFLSYKSLESTIFFCIPMLLFFWRIEAVLLIAPILIISIIRTWMNTIYKMFLETQLSIDSNNICLTSRFLGLKHRRISPSENITRIEYLKESPEPPLRHDHRLCVWVSNRRHPLVIFKSSKLRGSQLSESELRWLAYELSDWLDIPLQTSDKIDLSPEQIPIPLSTESTNVICHDTLKDSSKIYRPKEAKCTIKKDSEKIEITSSYQRKNSSFGCLFTIISSFSWFFGMNPYYLVFLGYSNFVVWMAYYFIERSPEHHIILVIDRHHASLWRSVPNGKNNLLEVLSIEKIKEIKLFYRIYDDQPEACHVKISTGKRNLSSEEFILVGNKTFWLSRAEAEWLAYELKLWLNLPVTETEVEVISNQCN